MPTIFARLLSPCPRQFCISEPFCPSSPSIALVKYSPVVSVTARNIEYKDPIEEEWEKFQKTIAEETNVSKTIIEEDLEVSTLERDIEQIDEQIQQWERVKNLQSLADDVKMKAPKKDGDNNDSSSTDEDLDEDDLLDWRSKGVKKL
ncbi:zinc finger protein 830 [Trichonephila clavipes]|nr:zinc finger protein 830 [Trichonephila clavipes]